MSIEAVIRAPRHDELDTLTRIEEEADQRYRNTRFHAFADLPGIPADVARSYLAEDRLLVAAVDDEPVAFIAWSIEEDPTVLGVSQVSVLSSFGRRGIGTRLMNSVLERARCEGHRTVVLATQAGVPWNEPWYRRLGFESVDPDDWTDAMRTCITEQQTGGIDWEHRVWMTLDLD